jgi:hypothetical protein
LGKQAANSDHGHDGIGAHFAATLLLLKFERPAPPADAYL